MVLLLAGAGGVGAAGVEQGLAGEAEEVVHLSQRRLGGQVVGVVRLAAEPLVGGRVPSAGEGGSWGESSMPSILRRRGFPRT